LEALLKLSAGPVTESMGVLAMEHLPDRKPKFVAAESEYLIYTRALAVRDKKCIVGGQAVDGRQSLAKSLMANREPTLPPR
jgi:hypothetical protein